MIGFLAVLFVFQRVKGDCKFKVIKVEAFNNHEQVAEQVNLQDSELDDEFEFESTDKFDDDKPGFFEDNTDFIENYVLFTFSDDYIKAFLKVNDWFEVKKCYFEYKLMLEQRIQQQQIIPQPIINEQQDIIGHEQPVLDIVDENLLADLLFADDMVNEIEQAPFDFDNTNPFKTLLEKMNEFRQQDIKDRFKDVFCKDTDNEWIVENAHNELPEEIQEFFTGTVWLLKCEKNEKNLIINSFGSTSVTSDFDYSVYAYNNEPDHVQVKKGYKDFLKLKKKHLGKEKMRLFNFEKQYFSQKDPATQLALLQTGLFKGELYLKENCEKASIFLNIQLVLNSIIKVNKSFKKEYNGDYGQKVDSNSYPDIMVINMKFLREEPAKNEISDRMKYRSAAMLAICHIAPYILKNNNHFIKIFGFDKFFEDCEARIKAKDPKNINIDKHRSHFFLNFPKWTNKNRSNISKCVMSAMVDPKNVDIYTFKSFLSICHVLVDEAYLSLGALEFYKFGSSKDLFYCHTLIEAFVENMSMLIEHIKDYHDKPDIDNRETSDKVSKYLKRAFEAITFPRCKNFGGKIKNGALFSTLRFGTWYDQNVIETQTFKTKTFMILPSKFGSIEGMDEEKYRSHITTYFQPNFEEQVFEYKRNHLKTSIDSIVSFADRLKRVRKAIDSEIEDPEYEYLDDSAKKELYFNHFKIMSDQLTMPNPLVPDGIDYKKKLGNLLLTMQFTMKFVTIHLLERFKKFKE